MRHTLIRGASICVGLWAAVAVLVYGCASLDKAECINADWKSIGFEDGVRGYKGSHIGRHREACARHGVAPDLDLYEAGRQQGLAQWCTPHNGYRLGIQGKRYNGVCPTTLEAGFMEALAQGRAVNAYGKEVKKQESRLEKMVGQLGAVDEQISVMEAELVSDDVSPRRRMKLLNEIRRLEEDQRYLVNDIEDMEQTLEDMRNNLTKMRMENPY
ncbi:MAG: DUF2799 domain-containing protein [Desulfobacteraceae bacterium]